MNKSQFARLGTFEAFNDVDMLRGTPFWTKRETITATQLQKKPMYRCMSLFLHMAEGMDMPQDDFDEYVIWVQGTFSQTDLKFDAVKRFQRTYGKFSQQRLLLTAHNAVELFIRTHTFES